MSAKVLPQPDKAFPQYLQGGEKNASTQSILKRKMSRHNRLNHHFEDYKVYIVYLCCAAPFFIRKY